jgi:hypothetical protein
VKPLLQRLFSSPSTITTSVVVTKQQRRRVVVVAPVTKPINLPLRPAGTHIAVLKA